MQSQRLSWEGEQVQWQADKQDLHRVAQAAEQAWQAKVCEHADWKKGGQHMKGIQRAVKQHLNRTLGRFYVIYLWACQVLLSHLGTPMLILLAEHNPVKHSVQGGCSLPLHGLTGCLGIVDGMSGQPMGGQP